jgi:4-diphosphocytidyl-2-C-methyl-D-erythritol kinase
VLVWPGVPAPTPAVYRAFDAGGTATALSGISAKDIPYERGAFLDFLARQRNDLTKAAWRVTPEIAEADAALRASDHALLVRMSGSGSAVFAIYENDAHAQEGASVVKARYPDWWSCQRRCGSFCCGSFYWRVSLSENRFALFGITR